MAGNIVLIGFMAVGKGRTARELARQSGRYAIDCDDLIESFSKMKIRDIFAQHGEPHFRRLEKETGLWLEQHVTGTIISTGGGFVAVPNLKKIGAIIHLYSDFDFIVGRILDHPQAHRKLQKRPLLKNLKKARKLYDSRLPVYRQAADLEIDVTGRRSENIARTIMDRLGIAPLVR
jgi:shikimate kinase